MTKPGKRQKHTTTRITVTRAELHAVLDFLEQAVGSGSSIYQIKDVYRMPFAQLWSRLQMHPELHRETKGR